ncbi:G protein-regulated inducer of neurite outgrowth 1 [Pogona vitticeps]
MGSAKEPETSQLLKQEAIPEDASHPSHLEKDSCHQKIRCDGGDLTMRNCCINDHSSKENREEDTGADNPNHKEKASPSSVGLAATRDTIALKDSTDGKILLDREGEKNTSHDLCHSSKQGPSLMEHPGSPTNACNSLERKGSPAAMEASTHLPSESCLKGAGKDLSTAASSLKHVAFLEPVKNTAEAESVRVGTGHSDVDPALPTCLENTSQEPSHHCTGETSHFSSTSSTTTTTTTCESVGELLSKGHSEPLTSEAVRKSALESVAAEAMPGKLGEPVAEKSQLDQSGEIKFTALETNIGGGPSGAAEVLIPASPQEVLHPGASGESQSTPGETAEQTEGLKKVALSNTKGQNPAQEPQDPKAASVATGEEHTTGAQGQSVELFAKTCSLEVTPPQHDAGTQADNRVSVVSVAISPINPPDGSTAFAFHSQGLGGSSLKSPGPEQKPAKKDVEMQVSIPVETRSVATGPMTPVTKSPQASYPEVHVKGAQEEAPEPVREVSWDEKGMTWEVYGASMEVEVLGMAIQKHLEKQIEEHGRQMVMTPQSTRSSSIKGGPHKGEVKRQPSVFRALLQNVRRPRCCSRGGAAVE